MESCQAKINTTMKRIETKITINATPGQVWATLINFQDYPDWNPFIVQLKGEAVAGTTLEAHLKVGDRAPQVFKPKVLVCRPSEEFRWLGKLFVRGLFDGEHYFQLRALPGGHTEFTHGEQFSGILSGLILKMIGADTVQGFERMNEALRVRVEAK